MTVVGLPAIGMRMGPCGKGNAEEEAMGVTMLKEIARKGAVQLECLLNNDTRRE